MNAPPRSARHLVWLCVCWIAGGSIQPLTADEMAAALRRPVGLAASSDGRWLYVANRDTGSVSIVDLQRKTIVAEHTIGRRLSDLVLLPGARLLALDEAAHELVVLQTHGDEVQVSQRLPVAPYPVSILAAGDGRTATIASLWSRRLTFVELGSPATIKHVLDLPFAPRTQLNLPGRGLVLVADAFSGKLALVDRATGKLSAVREIPGHNIRGLGVSPDGQMLIVAHQMLNDLAHSIRNDIHWGLLMSNDLRWLKVDSFVAGGDQFYKGAHMHPLGDAGRGGADPGAMDVAVDGTVVVTISGVNEVAFGKEGDFAMQRLKVGRRPTAVTLAAPPPPLGEGRGEGLVAYIANTLDDSISILHLKQRAITTTISLGPQPELSLAQRGELLFYDARLSHDGWMSCHSCHTDGHANGHKNDNFSDRSFGDAKRVLSLLGVKDTLPLAWSGKVASLEQQIQNSVQSTMQRDDPLPTDQVAAIAAYVETLSLPPPLDGLRGAREADAVERGRLLFQRLDCARCHEPPTFTSPRSYDVGLTDSQGLKEFNPPSLRGLSHRTSFLHDGSAATLEEVFLTSGHPGDSPYDRGQVRDLIAYLQSL